MIGARGQVADLQLHLAFAGLGQGDALNLLSVNGGDQERCLLGAFRQKVLDAGRS